MGISRKRKRKVVLIVVVAGIVLLGFGVYQWGRRDRGPDLNTMSTFTVQRGDLVMSVTESGTIKARNAVEIKSQVEGSATIVSLAPEGSYVTQDDVANGKILVELDSSKLRDSMNQQEITYNSAEADYTGAKEALTIQKNQNDSDIQQGLMNVKFGRMDLQKYLGEETANTLLEQYKTSGALPGVSGLINDPNQLGGESLQNYRKLTADIDLAKEEFERASEDLKWTEKLFEKSYVSKSELQTDQLKVDRLRVSWEQAKTALSLFIQYDFPKRAEELFSQYLETERQLERIYAQTRSKLAQSEAQLNSSEARYQLNKEQLERIKQQIEACTVKATEPGLVIYASSERGRFGGSRTYIEVGQDVRERELIMTVTNAAEKDVDVKVHETNVDKVRVGQQVKIVVDAQPDKVFVGKVQKIAPLPDPQSFFGNPDLKVYTTSVSIENVSEQIKPGMSARVEIIIAQLKDVLSIPVQSVANREGGKVCFVMTPNGPREQLIRTGAFNDRFVEVTEGLQEGQKVLLNPPRLLAGVKSGIAENTVTEGAEKTSSQEQSAEEKPLPPSDSPGPSRSEGTESAAPAAGKGDMENRLKQMDTNGDGKIGLNDEVPEQARPFLERLDTNKDGVIDAEEIQAAKNAAGAGRGGGRRGRPQQTDRNQEQSQ
jgi:HlyD family secretion protein